MEILSSTDQLYASDKNSRRVLLSNQGPKFSVQLYLMMSAAVPEPASTSMSGGVRSDAGIHCRAQAFP